MVPRKPGHSALVFTTSGAARAASGPRALSADSLDSVAFGAFGAIAGTGAAAAGSPVGAGAAGAAVIVVGAGAGAGSVGEASGSSAIASSRSSGVGVHRQCRSDSASPVMPPVLMSARDPHASRMATAIEARRMAMEKPRLATAHATSARHITGVAKIGSIMPMNPFEIDGCTMREVAATATSISTIAAARSDQSARLKNSHHTRMMNAPATPASMPTAPAPGNKSGVTTRTSTIRTAAATPGHRRRGRRDVCSPT